MILIFVILFSTPTNPMPNSLFRAYTSTINKRCGDYASSHGFQVPAKARATPQRFGRSIFYHSEMGRIFFRGGDGFPMPLQVVQVDMQENLLDLCSQFRVCKFCLFKPPTCNVNLWVEGH